MSAKLKKVGIVIVSYNASEFVRITLASLRRARTDVSYELLLIDNASESGEREKIRSSICKHIGDVGSSWRYLEQDKNLGFSGGNNVGINAFLADPEVTHICLLNSDVIVTDHWLDRLLDTEVDIVSAVTNKADSEQCVPVTYNVEQSDCLDHISETIRDDIYQRINQFSEAWHETWHGNLVEVAPTFFCVLLSVKACRDIGLLDENFFPGGFEDDDYCLRAEKIGYPLHLARDIFIHHWGSASFGQLQYEYFNESAQRNKRYLEEKHKIFWKRRPEKPIVSFAMDMQYVLEKGQNPMRNKFLDLYIRRITEQIKHFEQEFKKLKSALIPFLANVPKDLADQVAFAERFGDLKQLWSNMVTSKMRLTESQYKNDFLGETLLADLRHIAQGINERVECNFAMHAFITKVSIVNGVGNIKIPKPATAAPMYLPHTKTRLRRFIWLLRKFFSFVFRFDGVVFFGGYFYPERQSDGYFQRIQIVDRLFSDRWRVYVESDELKGRDIWYDRPQPKILVLRINGSKRRKIIVRCLVLLAVLRCRQVYFHSVLRMYDNRLGFLLRIPFIRKAVDIHGVVPEEFRMHNDYFSAALYEKEEKLAVAKAGRVILVTDAMGQYFRQKYRELLKAKTIVFPMFPNFAPKLASRPLVDGKPVVVYAGGLHKWQQVSKMIDAMSKTAYRFSYRFYCPEPQTVKDMLPTPLSDVVVVEAKTHAELMELYPKCHYGFILREDIIVNRVACPTKLVEYLAMGIIPIVDSENVGDFKALGMNAIRLDDFLAGNLPVEEQRKELAILNFSVYERLREIRDAGAADIQAFFKHGSGTALQPHSFMSAQGRFLPPNTVLGRIARRVRQAVFASNSLASVNTSDQLQYDRGVPTELSPCDILVQVDSFEAGGLENVVIDLNRTLIEAGYRVVLLVLGNQGSAVNRARNMGQEVICCRYSHDTHVAIVEQLQPKLVLAHYSFNGIPLYNQKGIPFVQVIHNIYMWFNEQQRRDFTKMASRTTAFVAVSDYVKNYSISRLGVPAEKCEVIPNGIDLEPFKLMDHISERSRLRKQYGFKDDEFVFLDVGAINHQKNHLAMVKSFEIAARACDNIRLAILGPCYEEKILREILNYIDQHGLQEKVIYCKSAPNVHGHLAMADAFASSAFFEGAQLTLLEALAANLPVAASAVGCASIFTARRGIRLVEPVYNMTEFTGAIWEMQSTFAFEQRLANAMIETWKNPERPDFSTVELGELDKSCAYKKYLQLIGALLRNRRVPVVGLVH